ncbi:hypothetical protein J6253_02445 [bacterium]|nr:hypothetical protein [bacterium]MBP5201577.1 hypothetical protein [bacterium]
MKKSFVLFSMFFTALFLVSCGSSESGKACESNLDCPNIGDVCSDGECVAGSSSEHDDSTEIPDSDKDTAIDSDTDTASNSDDDSEEKPDSSPAESDKDTETDDSGEENQDPDSQSDDDSDGIEIKPEEKCESFISETGCLADMVSEYPDYCDGFDNDCDGTVDEGCTCTAGETQACFSGKPAQRNIGICADGVQTCKVILKGTVYGIWGECKGEILPQEDLCDNADNNCNGCIDEGLSCSPKINCGYKIGNARPFVDKIIDGTKLYEFNDTGKVTWEWTVSKGPCDTVLGKTSFTTKAAKTSAELEGDGEETDVVGGVGFSQFKVNFKLSGNYTLHLKVTRENGETYECEWKLKVESDGLRVELCWDTTGPAGTDIDLHLGKNGVTTAWGNIYNTTDNLACYYMNCKYDLSEGPDWGYEETENYDKDGNKGMMRNPRLDMDNVVTEGKPENINLDNPKDGDTFRVLVHRFHFNTTFETHPVVNIYCGGTLKATYGVDPQLSDFKDENDSWEVVEIKWVGGYSSDACELTPKWDNGYVVNEAALPNYLNW